MKRVRNQASLKLHHIGIEAADIVVECFSFDARAVIGQIELLRFGDDHLFRLNINDFLKTTFAVIAQHLLECRQFLVKPSPCKRRNVMRNHGSEPATFCDVRFARVIDRVNIEMRYFTEQSI